MKVFENHLRKQIAIFAILHLVLLMIMHMMILKTLYIEHFYHNANVPIGFLIILNMPFLVLNFIYGVCVWVAFKNKIYNFIVIVTFQIMIVGLLTILSVMILYIRMSEKVTLKVYDTVFTTIAFNEKSIEIRMFDVLCTGSISLTILEIYFLAIIVRLYYVTKKCY